MKKAAEYVSGSGMFNTTSSAQSLAFHWLYFEGAPSTNLYEFFEQYAVATLFFGLTRARTNWAYLQDEGVVHDGFLARGEVCGWEGVRCAFNHTTEMVHVTEIRLSGKGLTGTISEEIAFLPYLNRLDLSENEIVGTVPEEIYGLDGLKHLYLNNNKLEGTISSSLDDLHLAEQIYLGQNSFTGTLPSNIGTNRPNEWRFFSIYDNGLTGPIPEGMKLKNAYMLDFSRNEFYGTIPNDIQQENYSTLRLLYMDHNTLTGTIPGSLMQMHKMKGIFFNDNRLEGMIPWNIDDDLKHSLLTIRVQNNRLTHLVSPVICALDVNMGDYELVELGVDCSICPSGCSLCTGRCYD